MEPTVEIAGSQFARGLLLVEFAKAALSTASRFPPMSMVTPEDCAKWAWATAEAMVDSIPAMPTD